MKHTLLCFRTTACQAASCRTLVSRSISTLQF